MNPQSYCNSNSVEDMENCYENFCKFYTDDNGDEREMKGRGTEETNSTSSSEITKSSINTFEETLLSSHHSLFIGTSSLSHLLNHQPSYN